MTLTAALAIVGALILAAIIAHGAWSARKAGPKRAQAAAPVERVEPGLGTLTRAPAELPNLGGVRGGSRREVRLDTLIDVITPIKIDAPISAELALTHFPASRLAGTKPFHIEGLCLSTGVWEPLQPGQRYSEFQAGVQMTNRSGVLNEIEYSEFVQKVQAFADAIGASAEHPDMLDAVARARELDSFASTHDAQLAITLRANSVAWSVGYIQQCAARHGFVAGPVAGRLVLPAAEDGAPPVLSLVFDAKAALAEDAQDAAVREATLWLDVPQSPESAEPFAVWQQVVRDLGDDMDAAPVDDKGAPVTLRAFEAIDRELRQLYHALAERGLAAGSPCARRLFS
jgi:hypothetical protein